MFDSPWTSSSGWEQACWLGLGVALKATLLLAAALALHGVVRRVSAVAGSMMWNACLVALALLPLAAAGFPRWPIECLPPHPPAAVEGRPATAPALTAGASGDDAIARGEPPAPSLPTAASPEVLLAPAPSGGSLGRWSTWCAAAYLLGLGICLLWLGCSIGGVRALRRSSVEVTDPLWIEGLRRWSQQVGVRRRVELAQSRQVDVPAVVDWLRPAILLPASAVASLSGRHRDAVLIHELAHVRRQDAFWQLLLRLLQAIYWVHPLVWLLGRLIGPLRERACDDLCIHWMGSRREYRRAILELAAGLARRRALAMGLAMVRRTKLESRLRHIDRSPGSSRCLPSAKRCLVVFAAVTMLAVGLGVIQLTRIEPVHAASAPADKPVTVLVVTPDGQPVKGIEVAALDWHKRLPESVRTDENGCARVPRAWMAVGPDHSYNLIVREGEKSVGWRLLTQRVVEGKDGGGLPLRITLFPRSRSLEGDFVNPRGEPLAGVPIRVDSLSNDINRNAGTDVPGYLGSAVSDARGHFSLKVPEYDRCGLVVEHPNHEAVELYYTASKPGPQRITLKPAGGVRGRVTDAATGAPIQGAAVSAQCLELRFGVAGYRHTVSDEKGEYALGSMGPGVWHVLFGRVPDKPEWTAPAVEAVEVKAGQQARADFRAARGRLLQGQLLHATSGLPIPDYPIGYYGSARPRSGAACLMVQTDAQGRFRFYVPPGTSFVYVAKSFEGRFRSRTLIVEPDKDPQPVILKGVPPEPDRSGLVSKEVEATAKAEESKEVAEERMAYTVRGTCRTSDGKPVPNAIIKVWPQGGSTWHQEGRYPGGVFQIRLGPHFVGTNAKEAHDAFYGPRLGKTYYLEIEVDGYARPKPVAVKLAKEIEPVVVPLERPVHVRVRGRVLDPQGQPVAGANVAVSLTVLDDHAEMPWGPEYLTGPDGRFEVKHLYVGNRFAVRIDKDGYSGTTSPRVLIEKNEPIDLGDLRMQTPAEPRPQER